MTHWMFYGAIERSDVKSSSSSSSTNFIATQVLNKTSGQLCVTYGITLM